MVTVTDSRNVRIEFDVSPKRIVSLVPSLTETIADLGCRDRIVGCTSFCELPVGLIQGLEKSGGVIGGTKNPDIEAIRRLKPDVVFANREENRRADVTKIEEFVPLHVSEPADVDDVVHLIEDLGSMLEANIEADKWNGRISKAKETLNELRSNAKPVRYVYLIWWNPAMVVGGNTYISHLLAEGPFLNACEEMDRYPVMKLEDLAALGADIIFGSTEPYDFNDNALNMVRNELGSKIQVAGIDGRICGWHGTRTAHALEYLRKLNEIGMG